MVKEVFAPQLDRIMWHFFSVSLLTSRAIAAQLISSLASCSIVPSRSSNQVSRKNRAPPPRTIPFLRVTNLDPTPSSKTLPSLRSAVPQIVRQLLRLLQRLHPRNRRRQTRTFLESRQQRLRLSSVLYSRINRRRSRKPLKPRSFASSVDSRIYLYLRFQRAPILVHSTLVKSNHRHPLSRNQTLIRYTISLVKLVKFSKTKSFLES